MRTRAYGDTEAKIAAADHDTIHDRWLYGLRLINDEDAIAPGGGLKHGVADRLVVAAKRRGVKLSGLEIRRRMQCARAYPKQSQIDHAVIDFGAWRELVSAGFPTYEAPDDEPNADWRTKTERDHASAQRLLDVVGEQGTLFPYDYEPDDTVLKDLVEYADQQAELTARFAERDRKRAEYLEELRAAVGDDLSVSWQAAHRAAYGEDVGDGDEL